MNNRILFDWLTFTSHIHSSDGLIELLGLSELSFLQNNGSYGYKSRLFFNGVSILFDGTEEMGICVEMSGQGCRTFENYGLGDWDYLFNVLLDEPEDINITRLDVAYDDLEDEYLDIDEICKDTKECNYVSKFRKNKVVYGTDGNSVELGTRQSEIMLRIYDKQAEQKTKDIEIDYHWVRVELQLRRERASVFLEHYCKYGNLGFIFKGLLLNYLRYVEDDNWLKTRCEMKDYWFNLIDSCDKITIWTKQEVDYNLLKLENFVINQAGNAIDCLIKIIGKDQFFDKLNQRESSPNIKYDKLLQQYNLILG